MKLSLQQRMILRVILAITLILVASGMTMDHFVTVDSQHQFDTRLLNRARVLSSEIEISQNQASFDFEEYDQRPATEPDYFQLTGLHHEVFFLSKTLAGNQIPVPPVKNNNVMYSHIRLPDNTTLRCVHLVIQRESEDFDREDDFQANRERPDSLLVLTLGHNTKYLKQAELRFHLIFVAVALITLLVLIFSLLALIRSTLAPVETLAAGIAHLDPTQNGELLGSEDIPVDFLPIVHRVNDMLQHLSTSLEREKTFSADFSHEMRTPLAGLRSTLEVGLFKPRAAAEYQELLRQSLSITNDLQSLTETMLALKRMEGGVSDADKTVFSLDRLVLELTSALDLQAQQKQMTIQIKVNPELELSTNRPLLELAVRNILENAISHGKTGVAISVLGSIEAEGIFLEVVNPDCDLTQEEAEALRARFRRGNLSREAGQGHTGLGLALVDAIAQALGFKVQIRVDEESNYRVRFLFL